ncbi:MAG TPA: tetratricopeptide repeat protein [Bryobacteraceae bacterium]
MTRRFRILIAFSVLAAMSALAQVPPPPPPPPDDNQPIATPENAPLPDEGNIPEADGKASSEPDYRFNPLQAKKEFDVGMFYFKKSDYRGAIGRFERAVKWNPGYTEAYFKLGEAQAKMKHMDEAKKALAKVIHLDPKSKEAKEAKKLMAKLEHPGKNN